MKHAAVSTIMPLLVKIGVVSGYFALMMLKGFGEISSQWQSYGLLAIGLVFGLLVSFLDAQLLFRYYQEATFAAAGRLASRSPLFLIALVPLSLFVVTSTGSPLGVGLVIGLLTSVAVDMVWLARQPVEFANQFLYQIKRSFTPQQIMGVAGFSVFWLLCMWLLSFTN